jgi:hypothetical protein
VPDVLAKITAPVTSNVARPLPRCCRPRPPLALTSTLSSATLFPMPERQPQSSRAAQMKRMTCIAKRSLKEKRPNHWRVPKTL